MNPGFLTYLTGQMEDFCIEIWDPEREPGLGKRGEFIFRHVDCEVFLTSMRREQNSS